MKQMLTVLFIVLVTAAAGWFAWNNRPRGVMATPAPMVAEMPASKPAMPEQAAVKPTVEFPAVRADAPVLLVATNAVAIAPAVNATVAGRESQAVRFSTPAIQDLGAVQMTDGLPVELAMRNGQTLVITPTLLRDGSLKLSAQTEGMKNNGNTTLQTGPVVTTRPGQAVVLTMSGGTNESFSVQITPRLNGF